jgi:hypothetical protein
MPPLGWIDLGLWGFMLFETNPKIRVFFSAKSVGIKDHCQKATLILSPLDSLRGLCQTDSASVRNT